MSKKSPLDGSETKKFLDEQQERIFRGQRAIETMPRGSRAWQAQAMFLSDWQRLHDIVEALYPAAHSAAQTTADEIAAGTQENDDG